SFLGNFHVKRRKKRMEVRKYSIKLFCQPNIFDIFRDHLKHVVYLRFNYGAVPKLVNSSKEKVWNLVHFPVCPVIYIFFENGKRIYKRLHLFSYNSAYLA